MLQREIRKQTKDDQAHLLIKGTTRCVIYRGTLADGTPSPGFVRQRDRTGAAYVWVAPKAQLEAHRLRPSRNAQEEAFWAAQHVRLVRVDWGGKVFIPEADEWDVVVAGPYEMSTEGRLVRRVGRTPDAAVPEGDTLARAARQDLLNRDVDRGARYAGAASLLERGDGEGTEEPRFPRRGEEWL